jgi:hypothetical protein
MASARTHTHITREYLAAEGALDPGNFPTVQINKFGVIPKSSGVLLSLCSNNITCMKQYHSQMLRSFSNTSRCFGVYRFSHDTNTRLGHAAWGDFPGRDASHSSWWADNHATGDLDRREGQQPTSACMGTSLVQRSLCRVMVLVNIRSILQSPLLSTLGGRVSMY